MSAAASPARAFTDPNFFWKTPVKGGSEGRWFSGAPTDGYGCDACHSGRPTEPLVIEGIPSSGYLTNKKYNIRIAWPEFAARTRGLFATQPPKLVPTASLVAEFVAESGDNSGIVQTVPLKDAAKTELCYGPRKLLPLSVYRQTPTLTPDPKPTGICEASNKTRCLVSVRGCGSEEVKFSWTSPPNWQGTIWFSVGFVATDQINETPLDDATTIVTIPIAPAGSDGYESELQQACTVTRSGATQRGWLVPWAVFAGLLLVRARRFRRRTGGAR
ncbi:MAG TPA: hypothetical protein VJR89_09050 [Polyangiales bacterium]|nr:hypothetical protein [Polyangiales bacterium]